MLKGFFYQLPACLKKLLQTESTWVLLRYVQCHIGELPLPKLDICGEGTMSQSEPLSLFERRAWENWMGLPHSNMGGEGYVMLCSKASMQIYRSRQRLQ